MRKTASSRRSRAFGALAAVAAGLAAACGDAPVPSPSAGRRAPDEPPRIASLSPALTATVVDLGLGDAVVARTPWCWMVPSEVPAVGGLLEIDYERLLAAGPEVLLVQPGAAGVDPELARLAARHGWELRAWRIERLADVAGILDDLREAPWIAAVPAASGRLAARAAELERLLAAEVAADAPRTLLLVSADPPTAAAEGTFLDELLRAAGGRNALAGRRGYPGLSLEEIAALRPEVTILLRDADAGDGAAVPPGLRSAVAAPVRVVASREAFLPSSRAAVAAEALAAALSAEAPE